MAFHIVIQTRAIQPISLDQRALLEAIIFPLLNTWEPVARFPGEKKFLTSYDNEQGLGSLMITIPFLTLHGNDENIREEIVAILTSKLDQHNCFIYLTGNTKERYLLEIPGELARRGFSYGLDYCPNDPLYKIVKKADSLLKKITRIKNQIGSHTNDAVMQLIKPELNKLIQRYNRLFKQPSSEYLINRSHIEKVFRDTKKQYEQQQSKISQSPLLLNKTAGNPVSSLSKDPIKIVFQFITLKEMHTVLFLVSKNWIPITTDLIILVLANKYTLPQGFSLDESKQVPLSVLRGLTCQLQTSILTGSKLNLDTAQKLIQNGFDHFNPTIKKDILKNTNLVNELMAKDHRYCFFFAKLMHDSFPNGAVEWTYDMQNNIDKLLNADDQLVEFFISNRCTGYFIQTFVEHADRLLTDLKKINMNLKEFICDLYLTRLFLKDYHEDLRHPAEHFTWQDYVNESTRNNTPALSRYCKRSQP